MVQDLDQTILGFKKFACGRLVRVNYNLPPKERKCNQLTFFLFPIRLNLNGGHQTGLGIQVQRGFS